MSDEPRPRNWATQGGGAIAFGVCWRLCSAGWWEMKRKETCSLPLHPHAFSLFDQKKAGCCGGGGGGEMDSSSGMD